MDLSKSFRSDLRGYLRTRLLTAPMAALLALLLSAVCFQSLPTSLSQASYAVGLGFVLIVQFRLWDDLADFDKDKREHPMRVICTTQHRRAFQLLRLLMTAITLLLLVISGSVKAFIALSLLVIFMAALYAFPQRRAWPLMDYHLVLLKYPTLVLTVVLFTNGTPRTSQIIMACVVYLLLCSYEVFHDPALRSRRDFCFIAVIEFIAAIGLTVSIIDRDSGMLWWP